MDLPTTILLTRCDTELKELARIETLSREAAKNEIDAKWWNGLADIFRDPNEEPDSEWEWRALVSRIQNKPYSQAKCVVTTDNLIQAAMLFRVDARSAVEAGKKAVFVDRLATAPWNREGLVKNPWFRGTGSGLLVYATALSYSLGLQGRVNLFPVAHESFYTAIGFQKTGFTEGGDTLFELPAALAIRLLQSKGLIDA